MGGGGRKRGGIGLHGIGSGRATRAVARAARLSQARRASAASEAAARRSAEAAADAARASRAAALEPAAEPKGRRPRKRPEAPRASKHGEGARRTHGERSGGGLRERAALLGAGVVIGLAAVLADTGARRAAGAPAADQPDSRIPPPPSSSPTRLSLGAWRRVLVSAFKEFNQDQITQTAAGVTFFGLLAIFPAIAAFVSLYGLFFDVDTARRQVLALQGFLPGGAVQVIGQQMQRLSATDHGRLGATLFVSLAVSLWSANAGVKAVMAGLNIAYELPERRNFLALNLVSLAFTLGAILFSLVAVAAAATGPELLDRLGADGATWILVLRWPALLAIVVLALALLYRFGPSRVEARWRWVTPGGLIAAFGWIIMSVAFSWYVGHFGNYDRTYGSLGAVAGFMTWIWLSVMVLLFGAELNDELERRAKGYPPPRNRRDGRIGPPAASEPTASAPR